MKNSTRIAAAVTAALIFTPHAALALGFRVTDLGADATARGGAFVATADNPSAVYHNPAGITQFEGLRSLLGVNVVSFETRVDLDAPGGKFDSNYAPQAVPHSYLTLTPKDSKISLGFGVYSPFGLAIEYPYDSPFRTMALKGGIQYTTWNPVVAWKITDTLSVAAGATINYSRAMLAQGVVTPGDEFQFKGAGVGYGYNLGVLWQPHRMHSFGVSYFSATDVTYSGHAHLRVPSFGVPTPFGVFETTRVKLEEDADAEINYPGTLRIGYSFRPTPDWNIEFDAEWTDWDRLNSVTLHQQRSADVVIPFNYESSWFYSVGVTRKLPCNLSASAGYIFSENSVPESSFNPLVPDSDRHVFSVGIGQTIDRYNWYVSYQYAFGPERDIQQGTVADGSYTFESHALSVSLGYNF